MKMTWREVAKRLAQMPVESMDDFVEINFLSKQLIVTDDLLKDTEKTVKVKEPGRVAKCMNKGHGVTEKYSGLCLECGRNICETKEEYYQFLMSKIKPGVY